MSFSAQTLEKLKFVPRLPTEVPVKIGDFVKWNDADKCIEYVMDHLPLGDVSASTSAFDVTVCTKGVTAVTLGAEGGLRGVPGVAGLAVAAAATLAAGAASAAGAGTPTSTTSTTPTPLGKVLLTFTDDDDAVLEAKSVTVESTGMGEIAISDLVEKFCAAHPSSFHFGFRSQYFAVVTGVLTAQSTTFHRGQKGSVVVVTSADASSLGVPISAKVDVNVSKNTTSDVTSTTPQVIGVHILRYKTPPFQSTPRLRGTHQVATGAAAAAVAAAGAVAGAVMPPDTPSPKTPSPSNVHVGHLLLDMPPAESHEHSWMRG